MTTEDTLSDSSTTERGRVHHKAETDGISLLEGEQMLKNLRPSWEAWWWQILVGGLLFLFGLIGLANGGSGGISIVGIVIIGYVAISRYRSRFFITDERVMQRTGLLRRSTNEVRIESIQNIQTDANIPERILSHGHIVVSSGALTGMVNLFALPEYKQAANVIREQQR